MTPEKRRVIPSLLGDNRATSQALSMSASIITSSHVNVFHCTSPWILMQRALRENVFAKKHLLRYFWGRERKMGQRIILSWSWNGRQRPKWTLALSFPLHLPQQNQPFVSSSLASSPISKNTKTPLCSDAPKTFRAPPQSHRSRLPCRIFLRVQLKKNRGVEARHHPQTVFSLWMVSS